MAEAEYCTGDLLLRGTAKRKIHRKLTQDTSSAWWLRSLPEGRRRTRGSQPRPCRMGVMNAWQKRKDIAQRACTSTLKQVGAVAAIGALLWYCIAARKFWGDFEPQSRSADL